MLLRTEFDDDVDPRRAVVDDLIEQGVLVPIELTWDSDWRDIPGEEDGGE